MHLKLVVENYLKDIICSNKLKDLLSMVLIPKKSFLWSKHFQKSKIKSLGLWEERRTFSLLVYIGVCFFLFFSSNTFNKAFTFFLFVFFSNNLHLFHIIVKVSFWSQYSRGHYYRKTYLVCGLIQSQPTLAFLNFCKISKVISCHSLVICLSNQSYCMLLMTHWSVRYLPLDWITQGCPIEVNHVSQW